MVVKDNGVGYESTINPYKENKKLPTWLTNAKYISVRRGRDISLPEENTERILELELLEILILCFLFNKCSSNKMKVFPLYCFSRIVTPLQTGICIHCHYNQSAILSGTITSRQCYHLLSVLWSNSCSIQSFFHQYR